MRRHLSTAFTAVLADNVRTVDRQTTVRVHDDTEQSGVCLLHAGAPLRMYYAPGKGMRNRCNSRLLLLQLLRALTSRCMLFFGLLTVRLRHYR